MPVLGVSRNRDHSLCACGTSLEFEDDEFSVWAKRVEIRFLRKEARTKHRHHGLLAANDLEGMVVDECFQVILQCAEIGEVLETRRA